MITRAYRIPRTLFPYNKRPTFVAHSPLFRISLYKDNTLSHARIAVVIAKKEISSAVERNTLRRKFYHGIVPCLGALQEFYVVISPRKESKAIKVKEITNNLKETLAQLLSKGS